MKTLLTTLLITSAAFASDDMRMRNLENRVMSLENSQNGCWTINPPARPFNPDCWGFYASIDPLMWQASVNGLPTVIETSNGQDPFNVQEQSRVRNLSFDWSWGVRLSTGLNLPYDGWDMRLQWTHFRTSANRNVEASSSGILTTVQGHPSITSVLALSSASHYDLNYDVLDLVNGRQFYVSKCVTLRPFTGLRTAWIKQEVRYSYPESVTHKGDRTFGIGILGGVDMQWSLGNNFSLFSNYAEGLLYGFHSTENVQTNGSNNANVGSFYHMIARTHDMQLGLRYNWVSCDSCYHLGFDLGWELHLHPGQNQMLNFADRHMEGKFFANQGDLGIQGLFASVRFDF